MDEELQPVTRDSVIEDTVKWHLKPKNILIIGILLGSIITLCICAFINLYINDYFRQIIVEWTKIPIRLWISLFCLCMFLIIIYFRKLKHDI